MKNIALEASAGSGKTFALAARYIALALAGSPVREILAITFTNKATSEMKERIVGTFTALCEGGAQAYREQIAKNLGWSEERVVEVARERLGAFMTSELKIMTFDAFFTGILRQFSLNLALMPDFLVGENGVSEFVDARFAASLGERELNELARYIAEGELNVRQAMNELGEIAQRDVSNLISQTCEARSCDVSNLKTPSDEGLKTKFETLVKIWNDGVLNGIIKPRANFKFEVGNERGIALAEAIADRITKPSFTKAAGALGEEFCALCDELKQGLLGFAREFENYKIGSLARLAKSYKAARLEVCGELNTLEFGDVSRLAHELLCGEDKITPNALYFRLDARVRDMLVDEFQDTSARQYEILRPLLDELLAGTGQNGVGSFFYVGDMKQSIYSWRGGKKELFGHLLERYPQIELERLDTNYRSSRNIVEFVNSTFGALGEKSEIYENYAKNPQKPRDGVEEGYVEVCEFKFEKDAEDGNEDFYRVLLEKVDFMVKNGARESDIAVLCWQNSDIDKIKERLEASGHRVASRTENLLINVPEIKMTLDFVKYALFGDAAWARDIAEYRDSNLKYSEETENLVREAELSREARGSLGASPERKGGLCSPAKSNLEIRPVVEILKYAAASLNLDIYDKNLMKLYELGAKSKDIFDFIFSVRKCDEKALDYASEGLTVMTVHKSKGLGFPHVIVCDRLGKDRPDAGKLISDFDVKSERYVLRYKSKVLAAFDEDYKRLLASLDESERDEIYNKLYVALTRAAKNMIIVACEGADGNQKSYFRPFGKEQNEYLNLNNFAKGEFIPSDAPAAPGSNLKSNLSYLPPFEKIGAQEISAEKEEESPDYGAICFGNALHYLLEMTSEFSAPGVEKAWRVATNKYGALLGESALEDIKARALALALNADFQATLEGREIFKEQEIVLENGAINRLDLLCVGKSEITVVDYKSGSPKEEHKEQVRGYMRELAKVYAGREISGKIAYLSGNGAKIVKVD